MVADRMRWKEIYSILLLALVAANFAMREFVPKEMLGTLFVVIYGSMAVVIGVLMLGASRGGVGKLVLYSLGIGVASYLGFTLSRVFL